MGGRSVRRSGTWMTGRKKEGIKAKMMKAVLRVGVLRGRDDDEELRWL